MSSQSLTNCIPCTIGVLTYNKAATLSKTLESIKAACEIIVADGGSTDDTLEIAKKYNCKIISQSQVGKPIQDFSLERNRMLDAAGYDLFFYVDADEFVSPELMQKINTIATGNNSPAVYWVRYLKTDPTGKRVYRTMKEHYQPRLFNRSLGVRFKNPIHEKISYPKDTAVYRIEEPWYVPVDLEDFTTYKRKLYYRIEFQVGRMIQKGSYRMYIRGLIMPFIDSFKGLVRLVGNYITHGRKAVPAVYEFRRMYYQWVFFKIFIKQKFFKHQLHDR